MSGFVALMLTVVFTAVSQTIAPAATEEEEPVVVFTVATRPEKCNLSLATKVDLLTLAMEPQKWTGRCVAVDGFWQHRALFAASRDTHKRYAQSNEALRGRRVGIYGTEELLSSAPRTPVPYTAIGIVGQCKTLGEGPIMVMGYCHYTYGPYIAVAEMRQR